MLKTLHFLLYVLLLSSTKETSKQAFFWSLKFYDLLYHGTQHFALGHHLIEVRKRSLHNILSKLENGIITEECLIHHRDLFMHLMQCLEDKEFSCDPNIIKLLVGLSKVCEMGYLIRIAWHVFCCIFIYFQSQDSFLSFPF